MRSAEAHDQYELITKEMITALAEEVEAIKKDGGSQRVPLYGGVREGVVGGRNLYSFTAPLELTVLDDTPARLHVDDRSWEAAVVGVQSFTVTLAVQGDLGQRVPAAVLDLSPYYLLEVLQRRLQETLKGETPAERHMALRLFNMLPNEALAREPPPTLPPREDEPNAGQGEAISRALGQVVTFVWGPPGTGKTDRVLNYLAAIVVERGERILLTSHTNAAVDAALRVVLKAGHLRDPGHVRDPGEIVRLGSPQTDDPELKRVTLDAIVEREGRVLKLRLAEVEGRLREAEEEHAYWRKWDEELAELKVAEAGLARAREDVARLERRRETLGQQIRDSEADLEALRDKLQEAQRAGWFRRLVSGLDPRRVEAEMAVVLGRLDGARMELKASDEKLLRIQAGAAEWMATVEATRARLRGLGAPLNPDEVRRSLQRAEERVEQLKREAASINAELSTLHARIIARAKVVATTLSRLSLVPEVYRSSFENLIVDEVSMIPQPYLWFASGRATKRIVVLGDFRQLAPISMADAESYPNAARRMQRDIFRESGILDDRGRPRIDDRRLAALNEQYRMHEAIGRLANEFVYQPDGNPLAHCAPNREAIADLEPVRGRPLVWCDTSAVDPWCSRVQGGYSRYNVYSALVTFRLLMRVFGNAPAGLNQGAPSVGVVTPYAAQARLLQTLMRERGGAEAGGAQVATVHRFQGNERDVMIVDLVDGPPYPPGRLLTDPDDARRLLNVAITRAKGKLIVVANRAYFESRCPADAPVRQMLDCLTAHAEALGVVDSRDLVGGYADPDVRRLHGKIELSELARDVTRGVTICDETTFYPAFLDDLGSARERVVIFSPFLARARAGRVVPALRSLVESGVPVLVFTRAERDPGEEKVELLSGLKQAGVEIVFRRDLHEKLAFIDERVVWSGSLNILSHSRSTEFMMRIEGAEFTRRLLEFSGVAREVRNRQRQANRNALLTELAPLVESLMGGVGCPACGGAVAIRSGPKGPFFSCGSFPACRGSVHIPAFILGKAIEQMQIPCPGCGDGYMTLRWSKRGPFLGCSRYPEDKTTLPL